MVLGLLLHHGLLGLLLHHGLLLAHLLGLLLALYVAIVGLGLGGPPPPPQGVLAHLHLLALALLVPSDHLVGGGLGLALLLRLIVAHLLGLLHEDVGAGRAVVDVAVEAVGAGLGGGGRQGGGHQGGEEEHQHVCL